MRAEYDPFVGNGAAVPLGFIISSACGTTYGGRTPDTAASAAAVNQLSGVPIVPEQWGGRMPDTAMSIAAVNQLPGVPIDKVNGVKYPTF